MKVLSLIFFCCLLFGLPHFTHAQPQYAFRISFTDKKGTTGDLSAPGTFLSSRALARRTTQSILVDNSDLPVSRPYVDTVLLLSNGVLHTQSRWQNNCTILLTDTSFIHLVRSKPYVKSVQYTAVFTSPLHLMKAKDAGVEDEKESDPLLKVTGGPGYYGDAYDQIKLANGDYLHDRGFRGKGKLIAVLDAGFNKVNTLPGYDSLRSSGRIADTYNFNLRKEDVYSYSSHGTEVLSTMAGILNGGFVGTAPDATYALYITEDGSGEQPFEMDNLVAGMERADSIGADIITISLGYNTFSIGSLNSDLSLDDIDGKSTIAAMGANMATQKGILVVASAGNDGNVADWGKILTPGDADSALTCGSVDINKKRALTSGKGPNAAGVRKPDVCMLGAPGIVLNSAGTTSAVNGTSIATPELAGLAACLWQTNPKATPYMLRKAIRESAHIAAAPDNELGYGVPDFGKASLSIADTVPGGNEGTVMIRPNPFKDHIAISIYRNGNGPYYWIMCDIQGKKILQGTEEKTAQSLDLDIRIPSGTPAGIYFLRLVAEDYTHVLRLQKL